MSSLAAVQKPEDEICPVCRLDTYMNPSMRFLINTECYHRMCESCVDRIFSQGPAKCPIYGCNMTLRKNKFKRQTFADLQVEREVDVRRRVNQVFNRRREEFDSLDEYNNYLEQVEAAIFNLVNHVQEEETEQKLNEYKAANQSAIKANATLLSQEEEKAEIMRQLEAERRLNQRLSAIEESVAEQELKKEADRKIIQDLATAKDGEADNIVKRAAAYVQRGLDLKKSSARRGPRETTSAVSFGDSALSLLNQRTRTNIADTADGAPFDPTTEEYVNEFYKVQSQYYDPFLDNVASNKQAQAAGFQVGVVYEQVLFDAFMGLGVFIEEEKKQV
ncbi:CDK-activating kinase assembly factor MAT1-domain-containing protein [Myxozyma melibiosi]|uniref:RNA polymerase II transcription factor B subunit 3 n=1 Tax=Myxozyma melibiosi TaxID=54550 RepID=A0ABR1EZR6_9ASCO